MIYTSVKVTIVNKNYTASIDRQIVLYKGDRNIEVQFEIVESMYSQYRIDGENVIMNLDASYGQLVVQMPDFESYVVSEITATKDGKIIFTIPQEMTDEDKEIGVYTFQIRLYDDAKSSRVTLPPVIEGMVIKDPIASEDTTE